MSANPATSMRNTLAIVFVTIVAALSARADIIPTLTSTSPSGSNFIWNYTANVTVDQMVQQGDFFTLYDFGNFQLASNTQPAGWTFSSSLIGTNPAFVSPADDPNVLNLTWTYSGTTPINGSALLGDFSVIANTNQLRTSDFAAEATRSTGPNAGSKVDNVGRVSVPVPEMSALLPILSVCGAGALASIPSLVRRRK